MRTKEARGEKLHSLDECYLCSVASCEARNVIRQPPENLIMYRINHESIKVRLLPNVLELNRFSNKDRCIIIMHIIRSWRREAFGGVRDSKGSVLRCAHLAHCSGGEVAHLFDVTSGVQL